MKQDWRGLATGVVFYCGMVVLVVSAIVGLAVLFDVIAEMVR